MADYAPKGVSYAGMVTGIVGAAGAVGNAIAEMAHAGGGANRDPADRPVTWREMGLIKESAAKDIKIAALEGKQYTDARIGEVKAFQAEQLAHNAASDGMTRMLQGQIMQLYGLTKLGIPAGNIMQPFPPPETASVSSGGTASTATGTGT